MNSVRFVGRITAVAMFIALAGTSLFAQEAAPAAGNAAVLHLFGAAIGLGMIVIGAALGIGKFAAAAAKALRASRPRKSPAR